MILLCIILYLPLYYIHIYIYNIYIYIYRYAKYYRIILLYSFGSSAYLSPRPLSGSHWQNPTCAKGPKLKRRAVGHLTAAEIKNIHRQRNSTCKILQMVSGGFGFRQIQA